MRVGIDTIELERVPVDEKFLNRVALSNEIDYINSFKNGNSRHQRIAALWCVKEAVFKCLGLGKNSQVTAKDVELCHDESGRPYIKLYRTAKKFFEELKLNEIEVSLSHTNELATAIAVAK